MRWIVALVIAISSPARADTVWNVKLPIDDKHATQLHAIDGDPNTTFPVCPCVTGVFHIAKNGESANYFTGTLDALAWNHKRKAGKSLAVKIRKTRALMGVHKDYRAKLHAIMRGSGQLVLREVTGGEWEVSAYTEDLAGDIFTTFPTWRAPKPPKPAKPGAFVDNAADASALATLINDYRATLKLPKIPISTAMTKVAQAHAHDLSVNKPVSDNCNMHSWSKQGSWTACCYDSSKEAARCMWKKPEEIAGFKTNGYEIAATASGITAPQALELWQNSPAHHAVMINKDQWKKPWKALGVAVEGDYAVAWFGEKSE